MPSHRRLPPRPPLVRPVPVDPSGAAGPTRGQAAGPRWRQTSRGLYVPADVDGTLSAQRVVEQAMRLPAGGAVTGWASLFLQGAEYLDGLLPDGSTPLPVPLALGIGGRIRGSDEVTLLRDPLSPRDVIVVEGVPCTIGERAAFDALRMAPCLVEAVVAIDMAAEGEVTSPTRVTRYLADRVGWRGVRRARAALELASEYSWSPNEVRVRMVWERDLGLPPPLVNRPLFDRNGRLLGYPDLLDEESGLVIEFDGSEHRRAARHADDVGREHLFRRHRLEVTRVTGPDLRVDGLVGRRLVEARGRALWLPPEDRPWTTTPPPGWDPGPSLDELLDHRDFMRAARRTWEQP